MLPSTKRTANDQKHCIFVENVAEKSSFGYLFASTMSRFPNVRICSGVCRSIWNFMNLKSDLQTKLNASFMLWSKPCMFLWNFWKKQGFFNKPHTMVEESPQRHLRYTFLHALRGTKQRKNKLSFGFSLWSRLGVCRCCAIQLRETPIKIVKNY